MFRPLAARVGRAVSVAMGISAIGSLGACAQLVGIDNTDLAGNSIQLVRTSIGATVERAPVDLEGLSATYLVSGGNAASVDRVAATAGRDGRWTTRLRAPAPVEATLPDVPTPIPRLYDIPSQHLQVSFDVLEHPGRAPAPDGAMFGVTVPLDAAPAMNESFQVYVVGPWLAHALPPTGFTVVDNTQLVIQPFGFTAGENLTRRPQIDRVTTQDAFLVLRYAGAQLTGVATAAPFEQTEATTSVTTDAMMPVAPVQTLDLKIAVSAMVARYSKVQPAVATPTTSWSLTAAPGYSVTSTAGPILQSGALDMAAVGLAAAYGNPFAARDWRTCFSLSTFGSRAFTPPGTTSAITLFSGFVALTEPPSQAGAELAVTAGISAAIPVAISLDSILLSTDGQQIKQPTGFVEVRFSLDKLPEGVGPVRYSLQVQELVPGAADTLDRRLVLAAISTEPRFSLPPEVFQAGHSYTLRAVSTLGAFQDADVGNLARRSLPLTQGYLDSAVILVTP